MTVLEECVQKIVDSALALIQSDPHQWSDRPCGTCRTVTTLIGKPFGCYEFQRGRTQPKEKRQ